MLQRHFCRPEIFFFSAEELITILHNKRSEVPVFDFSGHDDTGMKSGFRLENCAYVDFLGFQVANVAQESGTVNGVYGILLRDTVDNCVFTQLDVSYIGGWGFSLFDDITNISFINCDSHHNSDPYTEDGGPGSGSNYGGADGWQCGTLTCDNIYWEDCRAWANSDDGWDLRVSTGNFYLKNCWAFWNGYIPETIDNTSLTGKPLYPDDGSGGRWMHGGNGEGFKIQGAGGNWKMEGCLAFENYLSGYNNHNELEGYSGIDLLEFYNCVAYGNCEGINFEYDIPTTIKNCISFGNRLSQFKDCAANTKSYNDYNIDGGSRPVTSTADFVSLNSISGTKVDGTRQSDGSLPILNFLRLVNNSQLIDKGIDVGIAYNGAAPDLGAFEYGTGQSAVLITAITVTGAGGATTITVDEGTLQLTAHIDPHNATNQSVTWTTINGSGSGWCDEYGLFHAVADGTVTARAHSNDGTGIIATLVLTLSNQAGVILVTAVTVTGAGSATTIAVDNGTLQMSAHIDPHDATNQNVTWSVIPGTGSATITQAGVLTAVSDGTVIVRAIAQDSI
jgi:uncharacterized protein YjdB